MDSIDRESRIQQTVEDIVHVMTELDATIVASMFPGCIRFRDEVRLPVPIHETGRRIPEDDQVDPVWSQYPGNFGVDSTVA